jgi:hypothetical protein
MKHNSTKLTLRSETVRHLTGAQLSRASGGIDTATETRGEPTGGTVTRSRTAAGSLGAQTVTNAHTSTGNTN